MATAAPACRLALRQATEHWPNRNRASDGIMGDAAHQRRPSDHNLGNAFDLTHDPAHGVDCNTLSRDVINDTRVTYVIWNRQIYNRSRAAEGWRDYTGTNPHSHHMHVSIRSDARNDLSPWPWASSPGSAPPPPQPATTTSSNSPAFPGELVHGICSDHVLAMQKRLVTCGYTLLPDGAFGPRTQAVVIDFQRARGLQPDGIVGRVTWTALWKAPPPVDGGE